MAQDLNMSNLLGKMIGHGGDYPINPSTAITKKFSHILIGPNGAVVSAVKIRNIDVSTSKGYYSLYAGYLMCAGGDDYFDSITLASGSAEGFLYSQPVSLIMALTVDSSKARNVMIPRIVYTNSGNAGSKEFVWELDSSKGIHIQNGRTNLYFIDGSSTVTIPNLTYINAVGTAYVFKVGFDYGTWEASSTFNITSI